MKRLPQLKNTKRLLLDTKPLATKHQPPKVTRPTARLLTKPRLATLKATVGLITRP